jgi:HSP20 family protein
MPFNRKEDQEMALSQFDPFQALFELQRALDSNLRSDWLLGGTAGEGAFPPINIFQKGDDFLAIIELPGMDKSQLEIQVRENVIRLSGKKLGDYPEGVSTHRRERVFGTFDRTISVPVKVDADGVKAEYREGVLALFIPRATEDKPRKVKVN